MSWGPYIDQGEATVCLSRFVNASLGTDLGIVFCDRNAACLIRRPHYDPDGKGFSLIVQSHGPVQPPAPKEAPAGFLARVEKFFEEASSAYVRQQMLQAQVGIATSQAIARWLSNPTHEHEVGLAVDVLGIVSFFMLFVQGVGEAEMGLIGAFRAAMAAEKYWQAAGLATGAMGFVGSLSSSASDSIYMFKRYDDGPDGEEKATRWDDGLVGQTLSVASVVLSLPDFFVGGVLLVRDLPEIAKDAAKTTQEAGTLANRAESLSSRAGRIDATAANSGNADLASRAAAATGYARQRARILTEQSVDLSKDAHKLYRKLYLTMMVNGSATFVGAPMMDTYFRARRAESFYTRCSRP